MLGIKSIVFKNNNEILNICIDKPNKVIYNNMQITIDNEMILKYLESLFRIIDNWKNEYINPKTIDGNNWELSIIYNDNSEHKYYGHHKYPTNFEAFLRLNQELIAVIQNG